jgi:ferredoxin
MSYVVAEPCVKCKYTECVSVCPVDCFQEGETSLAINPDQCIDCGMCEPVCPSHAIFEESELPAKWGLYRDLNAVFTGARTPEDANTDIWPKRLVVFGQAPWPNLTEQKQPMPGADAARLVVNKLDSFSTNPGSGD